MARESNSVETYMPLVIEKYLGDTMRLSTVQHGAYLLLLMNYWREGGPLPDDDGELAAIVKAAPSEWKKLRPVMARFFRIEAGKWHQKRADEELAKARKKSETAAASARARWEKDAFGDANASASADAAAMQADLRIGCGDDAPPSSILSEPSGSDLSASSPPAGKPPRSKPKHAMPSNWGPLPRHTPKAIELGLTAEHVPRLARQMRSWAAANGVKRSDWDAQFDGFIEREAANGGRNGQPGQSGSASGGATPGQIRRDGNARAALASLSGGGSGPAAWDDDDGAGSPH